MSIMSELHEYEKHVIDSGAILGVVTWYSVTETLLPHEDLVDILKANRLEHFAPSRPSDVDVFRRVATGAQRKRQPTTTDNVYENVLVRDVSGSDGGEVLKRIVTERVDPKGRRLDYQEQFDVRFFRGASQLQVKRIGTSVGSAAADEVAQEIVTNVPAQLGHVNGAAIRDLINRALVRSNAVSVRPGGGTYFVHRDHVHVVDGLEALANAIPDAVVLGSVPLPDVPKQRAMITRSVEFEASAEIERTMGEIKTLLTSSEKITAERVTSYMTRFRTLKGKAAQFADLLETNLGSTNAALDILSKQLGALAGKAE